MQSYSQTSLLIVENLSSDQQLIRYALEELGYEGKLEFLPSGQSLIDRYFGTQPSDDQPLPDLILLDLNLEDMPGQEVLERFKQGTRTCVVPVVIFSSTNSTAAAEKSYTAGAGGFVRKPTDFDELKHSLEGILNFWLQPVIKRNAESRRLRFQ